MENRLNSFKELQFGPGSGFAWFDRGWGRMGFGGLRERLAGFERGRLALPGGRLGSRV